MSPGVGDFRAGVGAAARAPAAIEKSSNPGEDFSAGSFVFALRFRIQIKVRTPSRSSPKFAIRISESHFVKKAAADCSGFSGRSSSIEEFDSAGASLPADLDFGALIFAPDSAARLN